MTCYFVYHVYACTFTYIIPALLLPEHTGKVNPLQSIGFVSDTTGTGCFMLIDYNKMNILRCHF